MTPDAERSILEMAEAETIIRKSRMVLDPSSRTGERWEVVYELELTPEQREAADYLERTGRIEVRTDGPGWFFDDPESPNTQPMRYEFFVLTDAGRDDRYERRRDASRPTAETQPTGDALVAWADYRNGPGGEWLTAEFCRERFGVTYKNLQADPSAFDHRRKHPEGRGFVYRQADVASIANRKPDA